MEGLQDIKEWKASRKQLRVHEIQIEPVPDIDAISVKGLRKDMNLTQMMFAQLLGVSKKTVETWEEGRSLPNGPTRRLIEILWNDQELPKRQQILMMS
jgi:putative transcriptional regulator